MKNFPLLAMLFLSAAAAANVYKWTDTGGAVHFSDKPPATAAEKLDIETRRTDPAQLATQLEEAREQQEIATEQSEAERAELERVERENKIRRDENCARAKKARDSLLSATRIYEPLPGGGRRYLEQDEVDQRMAEAKRNVDEWCNQNQ